MNIGIVGLGIVGSALRRYYHEQGHAVYGYDIKDETAAGLGILNAECSVVFVCVGTRLDRETGLLDCSQVDTAIGELTGEKTVIIKSTVMPGTTDAMQAKYPQHRIFFVPEFLSEATAYEDYANPRRPHVVGYTEQSHSACDAMFDLLPICKFGLHCLRARQAELLKLATNAFYALKVTFAQQLHDIGMTQEAIDALAADPWIVASHFDLDHKNYRGFGGPCLVKDSTALASYGNDQGVFGSLVATANQYNRKLLAQQGRSINEWL